MKINLDDHVGKKLIAFDVGSGVSPTLECIQEADVDENELAAKLNARIHEVFKEMLGETAFPLPFEVRVHGRTGIIKPKEVRDAEYEENRAELAKYFEEADRNRVEAMTNHPDNGKNGYWRVEGIRHDCVVRASGALEAIEKAKGRVGDWESPEASYIGEQLPEVY